MLLVGDGVDVVGQRQRHHIGLEPVDHRARLLAGAAVRSVHFEVTVTGLACQCLAKAR
jgi:hypothetical protein